MGVDKGMSNGSNHGSLVPSGLDRSETQNAEEPVPVHFRVSAPGVQDNECVALLGSSPELGEWDSRRAIKLQRRADGRWEATVTLLQHPVAYKYLILNTLHEAPSVAQWEALPGNRFLWPGCANAARGAAASASSTQSGLSPSSAVDGNVFWDDGNRHFETLPEVCPWYEVDVLRVVDISRIIIYHRLLAQGQSSSGSAYFHLVVADEPFPTTANPADAKGLAAAIAHARFHHQWFMPCMVSATGTAIGPQDLAKAFGTGMAHGRVVRLYLENSVTGPRPLQLLELQLFTVPNLQGGLCVGAHTSESSMYHANEITGEFERQIVDDGVFGSWRGGEQQCTAGGWLCPATGGELRLIFGHIADEHPVLLRHASQPKMQTKVDDASYTVYVQPEHLQRDVRRCGLSKHQSLRRAETGQLPRPVHVWALRFPPGSNAALVITIEVRRGMQLLGRAHLVGEQLGMSSMADHILPLIGVDGCTVRGTVHVRHLMTAPFRHPANNLASAWHGSWRRSLNIGHRGVGKSFHPSPGFRRSHVVENTLHSMLVADRMRTDFVEFDVQLTQDKVPIVYHDHSLRGVVTEEHRGEALYRFNIHELTHKQLGCLRKTPLPHGAGREPLLKLFVAKHWYRILEMARAPPPTRPPTPDQSRTGSPPRGGSSPFGEPPQKRQRKNPILPEPVSGIPSLTELLIGVPERTGFNIEIKWPIETENLPLLRNFWDMNLYLDRILDEVFTHGGARPVVFSTFDPDVCVMLSLKQARYKVFFLTCSGMDRECYKDARCQSLEGAAAVACGPPALCGIVAQNTPFLKAPDLVAGIKSLGLQLFTWGDHTAQDAAALKAAGVDAVIADNIGDITIVGAPSSEKKH
eukprot:TRINITY_DN20609_c0_g1_i1.p1 TRINITY_DN20609_c0_g1~~TRINITY_DN20609_c0_g1_i1.p1  ORF type:complete len:863 (+),score=188.07 TRINITY_DN20609_c0_g1_i1:140-2728(+)